MTGKDRLAFLSGLCYRFLMVLPALVRFHSVIIALLVQSAIGPASPPGPSVENKPLDQSAYFAFVDREYIFTVEMVKPGVPLLNFISMSEKENNLEAKEVRLTLENRKVAGKVFMVDTGDSKEPVVISSVRMRPRSSFGMRLQGEFGSAKELLGVTVRVGAEDFSLAPLTSFDFENLALKVNKLNLGSPDFNDDWRVLKMAELGTRVRARRLTGRNSER